MQSSGETNVLLNLAVDIATTMIDPRVRFES